MFLTFICLYSPIISNTSTATPLSYLQISVRCKTDNSAIDNATICIINNYTYYQTNKYGRTEVIKIPLTESWKKEDYYLINLLCYKKGFTDYLYFNLKLKPNQKRMDIVLYLEEVIDDLHCPTIYFEEPTESEIEEILNEYKKIGKKTLPILNIFT